MCNSHIFTPFVDGEGLFQHLEAPPMDDYHEFKHTHDVHIEDLKLYWLPNYVSII